MSKTVECRLELQMDDDELSWEIRKDDPYKYHATLTHRSTGMVIEQVSEVSKSDAKIRCFKELKWRLKYWDDYTKARIRKI